MIKKLRLKFILISMISVFVVLFATISIINVSNYVSIENEAKAVIQEVIRDGVKEENDDRPLDDNNPGGGFVPRDDKLSVENHYYIVAIDNNGQIVASNYRHIFSISEASGNELALSIYKGEISGGKYKDFRYALETKSDNLTYIAVVDIKDKLDNFNRFLLLSSTISIGAYAALFGLIILASYIAFKPSIESYKKQKQFITNASHELKTPLTIISTDLDLIEMDNGKSEWSDSIRDQVSRLVKMTNQLVTLSKLDENDLSSYPFSDFSVNEETKKIVDTFISSFKKEDIDFKYEVEDDLTLRGNPYLYEELISIFLSNSLKYTDGNSKESNLVIKKLKKDKIELTFSNSLDENDEVDPNLMSERFYRSPSVKKEGSGIGLSIAKEIIKLHKAKFEIKKENNYIYFIISF